MIDVDDICLRWRQAETFLTSVADGRRRELGPGARLWRGLGSCEGDWSGAEHHQSRDLRVSIGPQRIGSRVRRAGGGRKSAVVHQPDLPAALETLIEDAIRGDPCSPLRWVSRSLRHLVKTLAAQGFQASQRVVANLRRQQNYSCQANRKTREGGNHPDRDAQFAHINATVKAAIAAGEPAISVDTKKKELVGDFKNNGRELRRKGDPEPVRVHDFKRRELGKVAPYGVYDIAANHGWGQCRHRRRYRSIRR